MNVKIVKENCICCGACEAVDNTLFRIADEAEVIREVTDADKAIIEEAITACPTSAIISE